MLCERILTQMIGMEGVRETNSGMSIELMKLMKKKE
jgi:hypothetical protein